MYDFVVKMLSFHHIEKMQDLLLWWYVSVFVYPKYREENCASCNFLCPIFDNEFFNSTTLIREH